MTKRRISHGSELVIAFFLGSATDAIAWDPSDNLAFIFLPGCKTVNCVAWYYDWVPFFFAISFAIMAYAIARYTPVSNRVVLYFYLVAVGLAFVWALFIPGAFGAGMFATVVLGTIVAVGLTTGMIKKTGRYNK